MTIYFTSDLHFSHGRIMSFCPRFRPFAYLDEMDEYLIKLWNDRVGPDDDVYDLGDFTWARSLDKIKELLGRLNGRHHLIYGNHDEIIRKHHRELLAETKADGNPLLSTARDYISLRRPELSRKLHLFHYPVQEWEGMQQGSYLLHGHIHNSLAPLPGRILNVGFDLHGRLLTLEDIRFYLEDIRFHGFQPFEPEPYQTESDPEAQRWLLKDKIKSLNPPPEPR